MQLAFRLPLLMPRHYKWYVVAMLWWIAFFNYADRQAIFSVFPLLKKEFALDQVQLGLLGSAFAWIYGLSAPFAGAIVDRVRRKSAILAGLHVWSLICIATAISRNFATLLFFRGAEALGETFYFPASMSMLSDYHSPETRSRALGFHQTSVYVGTIAGGFFAGLIGQRYGWRWSFVVFGGLGILLGIALDKWLLEPARGLPGNIGAPPAGIGFLNPTALLLMAAFTCANFVALVLLSWMPAFLFEKFNLSLAASGLTATLFVQLASMAGSPASGWCADILSRKTPGGRMWIQAIGLLCGAPFVVLCGWTRSVLLLIVALTAWGFFKGIYDANIFASIFDVIPPDARGKAAGLMNMTGWLGGGVAPVAVGFVAQRSSLSTAIMLAATVYILGAVLLCIAAMRMRRA
ncbi:MAG TPA: MFS transporter [Bryobacteraceae bacterium]|nr:MFS transporter [Bryobacteraceae bacterium]